MTLPKQKQPYQKAKSYCQKPEHEARPKLKLARTCLRLDCERNFIANSPFQRLCELHREGD